MKTKYKIIIIVVILGLVSSYLINMGHKKLLKMAVEPINKELTELKKQNKALTLELKKDSLEVLKLIRDKYELVQFYNQKIDSISKNITKDEKIIIDYGGDFNSRFRIFSEHLTNTN